MAKDNLWSAFRNAYNACRHNFINPLWDIFQGYQFQSALMALIPIYFAEHTTGIFAIDMCIQSLIITFLTGGLSFFVTLSQNIFEYLANLKSDAVIIRVEHHYIDQYGDFCVNDSYLAIAWLLSRLAQHEKSGVFRMVPLDYWIWNFTKEMEPVDEVLKLKRKAKRKNKDDEANAEAILNDPTAVIAAKYKDTFESFVLDFSLLPNNSEAVKIDHEGHKFEIWFDQDNSGANESGSESGNKNNNNGNNNNNNNNNVPMKMKPIEPTICVKCTSKPDVNLEWYYNWLIRVTREYNQYQETDDERGRYEYRDGFWLYMSALHGSRGIQSVALDLETEKLLRKDLNTFLSSKSFYSRIGVPYKRGIMLSGRPGVGKTTLIHAISASLNRDLYFVNLKQIKTDSVLQAAISRIAKESILVFEDIDAQSSIVHKRAKKFKTVETVTGKSKMVAPVVEETPAAPEAAPALSFATLAAAAFAQTSGDGPKIEDSLTLSTFLGCLDGYIMPQGTICIFTTNHPEVLDPAVIRPGRIDLHLELGYCTQYQLTKMYCTVMDDDEAMLPGVDSIAENVLPPCEAMRIMCLYREDGPDFVSEKLRSRVAELLDGAAVQTDDLVQMRLQEEIDIREKSAAPAAETPAATTTTSDASKPEDKSSIEVTPTSSALA